jgi:hypothetical protein
MEGFPVSVLRESSEKESKKGKRGRIVATNATTLIPL